MEKIVKIVNGREVARTPANDDGSCLASEESKKYGAKHTVSCRVGPNNADSDVVKESGSKAACALVHDLEVAVEYVTGTTTMSNCCTYCVH